MSFLKTEKNLQKTSAPKSYHNRASRNTAMRTYIIYISVAGDDDKKQKVALYLLCHLLAKKGSEDTMVYIYEKCMVGFSYVAVLHAVISQCLYYGTPDQRHCEGSIRTCLYTGALSRIQALLHNPEAIAQGIMQ